MQKLNHSYKLQLIPNFSKSPNFTGNCAQRQSQDFRLGGKLPGALRYPIQIRKRGGFGHYFFQRVQIIKKIKNKKLFVSLWVPVLGQKAPIPGLKGTILGPEGPILGLKGLIPGLRRPISGLERTTLGLRFYVRRARPIPGLRRAFASLRRSKLGLRSNLVHFYLRRVYTDLNELISDLRIVLPHLLVRERPFHARGIKFIQQSYSRLSV